MKPVLAMLGAGGHACDVIAIVDAIGSDLEIAAIDEGRPSSAFIHERCAQVLCGRSVGDAVDDLDLATTAFVASVGYPGPRRDLAARAEKVGLVPAAALVHPSADVARSVRLGAGVVVFGGVWLSPLVSLSDHVHVGYRSTIGHETRVGAFSAVMPGAAIGGNVEIGESVLVGANATVLQGLHIGDGAVIGAGAVVTGDVAPGATVVGVPAKPGLLS